MFAIICFWCHITDILSVKLLVKAVPRKCVVALYIKTEGNDYHLTTYLPNQDGMITEFVTYPMLKRIAAGLPTKHASSYSSTVWSLVFPNTVYLWSPSKAWHWPQGHICYSIII
jgi:hypothetical protein